MRPLLLLLVGLLALLQYQLWFGEGGIKERRALERQAVVGEDANATLRQRNDTLARQVLELQEGTEMLEAVAREELGLVREGEEYILFIDEKPEEKVPWQTAYGRLYLRLDADAEWRLKRPSNTCW